LDEAMQLLMPADPENTARKTSVPFLCHFQTMSLKEYNFCLGSFPIVSHFCVIFSRCI
jgi:hypothetical protein